MKIVTIDQLRNNTEETIKYVLKETDILITSSEGNVIIMKEDNYRQYEIDHFKIIYQQIRDKIINRKK